MKRSRTLAAASLAVIVLVAMVVVGIALAGGGDDEPSTNGTPSDAVEAPTETATPTGGPGALPPEFYECLADQGVVIESPDEIHSVPQQALQACFGSLHGGGGAP
jgi:hypothetical protein